MNRLNEVSAKLEYLRDTLRQTKATGVRLRETGWFAWATAGASNTVLLAAETGVAEVLITPTDAWILTDEIEAHRLKAEELPEGSSYKLFINAWTQSSDRESFVREVTNYGTVVSDRPSPGEVPLPPSLLRQRQVMLPSELERYRQVGRLASEAMTEVLTQAQPTWTEYQLAGAGAEALWARGLHPALILVGGNRRLPLYRHPLPSQEEIGRRAMLVFCARRYGLIVSLTRFVYFGGLSQEDATRHHTIAEIEAIALNHSQAGTSLNALYNALATAYEQHGYPNAIREHHQGGTAGYGAREMIATPETGDRLAAYMVVAWNPSIPGAKIEDTFAISPNNSLENLSFDPQFPHSEIAGRLRPLPLER